MILRWLLPLQVLQRLIQPRIQQLVLLRRLWQLSAVAAAATPLNPITSVIVQTAADGSLQTVTNLYTPIVTAMLSTNPAGAVVTVTATTTPGLPGTAATAVDPATPATLRTLPAVTTAMVQTAADGSLQTVTKVYSPILATMLSTNPAGAVVTVTGTTTPGVVPTTSAATATSTAGLITKVITSTLPNGGLTIYTTALPTTQKTTLTEDKPLANPNHRPDPTTSYTPLLSSPVTTLSWQSYITITEGTTTYTTSHSPIIIYVTITRDGAVMTPSTTFIQRFSSQYTSVATFASGSIGLGSISGRIGVVKTNLQSTIDNNRGANSFHLQATSLFGAFILLLSWVL
ncbi:Kre1p KNAG_0K02550 [Huiozyma naganishii CBS 8797]|uniref:Uncharacterized protein n=1 Tax=Huiozyma naganishii (strain ATCC MYA-139 / BCRC 22969 / CBS 8797 / KCTC 17520 / NBRC 10181 / NCYC 3082 / Yp74L-3) TaxID=1071383 RepID=J7RRW2_HUIN7|nr:hypothetical protein KNAG_0K02550 [Kazachstania naganishii CBS 8797]CCK72618.1 hypothetical protein KNAG_0K02550 [Kazachstania naganishii CBS 8797]